MSARVWVMAAGSQKRWGIPFPKQLVPIGQELLIKRTLRQLRERGLDGTVITRNETIIRFCRDESYVKPSRSECRWLVENVLTHVKGYSGRQIVLLGDVIFSDATMDAICSCIDPVRVFLRSTLENRLVGFYQEIFGFTFDDRARGAVIDALEKARQHALRGGAGKLREFYCALCGFPFTENGQYSIDNRFIHWPVDDWTDDIDSVDDYGAFIEAVVVSGELDRCRAISPT